MDALMSRVIQRDRGKNRAARRKEQCVWAGTCGAAWLRGRVCFRLGMSLVASVDEDAVRREEEEKRGADWANGGSPGRSGGSLLR